MLPEVEEERAGGEDDTLRERLLIKESHFSPDTAHSLDVGRVGGKRTAVRCCCCCLGGS